MKFVFPSEISLSHSLLLQVPSLTKESFKNFTLLVLLHNVSISSYLVETECGD